MKMMSTAGLLAIIAATAPSAFAQSSLTLYGMIDEGPEYNSNAGGKHLYNLTTAAQGGSRWGFRGSEDLGGGLSAIFRLENGFDLGTGKLGQGGLMFGRQAYVGLASTRFGSVTLGRQYDSVVDYIGPLTVGDQWGGTIGSHPGDLDNFDNSQRTNNSVKYASANYDGITFGGLYSLGGVAGNVTQNQVWSLGAGYTNGPLALGAAYLNVRNPNVSFFGNSTTGTATPAANAITSPVYSGYASANTYQVIGAGGNYTIGAATLGATYSNTKFMGLGNTAQSGPNPRAPRRRSDIQQRRTQFQVPGAGQSAGRARIRLHARQFGRTVQMRPSITRARSAWTTSCRSEPMCIWSAFINTPQG